MSLRKLVKKVLPEKAVARLQEIDHWYHGEPELRFVKNLCDPHKISIDVGANIGSYTALMRRHSGDVVAYEPNPRLAERLRRLYPDVKVRGAALSNAAGSVVLSIPIRGNSEMHELGSIAESFSEDGTVERFTVEAVRLDDEGHVNVGFLKIDAEQHEREVLQGAMETIKSSRPVIMTEVTPLLYEEGVVERFRFLQDAGFRGLFTFAGTVMTFAEFRPAEHADPAAFGTPRFMRSNIFFVPEERDHTAMFSALAL